MKWHTYLIKVCKQEKMLAKKLNSLLSERKKGGMCVCVWACACLCVGEEEIVCMYACEKGSLCMYVRKGVYVFEKVGMGVCMIFVNNE